MIPLAQWRNPALVSVFAIAAGSLIACSDEQTVEVESEVAEACQTNEEYFLHDVWGPVLDSICVGCHNPQGLARDSDLVLLPDTQPGFIQVNMASLQYLSDVEYRGRAMLLAKPIGDANHGGGPQIAEGGPEYRALAGMINRFSNPVVCDEGDRPSFFTGVTLLDELDTLRRASILIGGRLPTPEEERQVAAQGIDGLNDVLDRILDEEPFYTWLRTSYNDLFLTDRYLRNDDAVELLDDEMFPEVYWWDELEEGVDDPALIRAADRYTNTTVAREVLDLITYVVRDDRPFTEILTADYRLVNGFSARTWGITDLDFDDPLDPNEFRQGRTDELPLAGILTSPMFLNRFPTTATNRNRHRARMVYQLFLATDVLKLAEQPLDPTQIEDFNPTLYNPSCTVCHAQIDPLGGAFQNWDAEGRYRPPEDGWFTDMRPPGFGGEVIPHADRHDSLQWLARQITRDRRFALSAVHTMFTALTGQDPLAPPGDQNAANYEVQLAAYDAQREFLDVIVEDFIEARYNLKSVIKNIVLSPYFRAVDLDVRGQERVDELSNLGTGRLLTPEQLNRKIQAVTGYPWRSRPDRVDYLLSDYLIFYGGIDSIDVNSRITDPNGVIASIGIRMAVEMACRAVPRDFHEAIEDRLLFPLVEPTYVPEDVNGFAISEAAVTIRQNIQYLHQHILGERLAVNDPEIDRTYQLFYDTWREGVAAIADESNEAIGVYLNYECQARDEYWTGDEYPEEEQLRTDPNYAVRAWMAVVTYLLADYGFLYE
jgi:hypothetical protein